MNAPTVAQLVPHTGAMVLLDELADFGVDHVACIVTVRADMMFADAERGLPAWAGIELMAQAIAVWNGCTAQATGDGARPGFLLGTRRYQCNVDAFALGATLRVTAERGFNDPEGMAAFDCRIECGEQRALARLTVFSPPDASALLAPDHPPLAPGNPA